MSRPAGWPARLACIASACSVLWALHARAQSVGDAGALAAADGGEVAAPPALSPPELQSYSEAEYPADARAAGLEATVVLRLAIEADGHVSAADVVEPAGHGFDEAAQAAALKFVFTPARRGDTPLASRILYRYMFELPPSAAEEPSPPPAPAPPPPPAVVAAHSGSEVEVQVQVQGVSEVDRMRRSAEAVTVVDTTVAQRRSADLGDVLVAIPGVNVRREGGLGSSTKFSLNGLSDEQIRLFLDGLPLELSGYPFGIANVPVNLVKRIEVYSGVVPIRFGADALGGAVNLVSDRTLSGTHGAASYQLGSFETHRLTLNAQHVDDATGLYAQVSGLLDYAKNNYPIDVDVSNAMGQVSRAKVYRFHDAYAAEGGNVELGVVDRAWAERLVLRGFLTHYYKEYQSNLIMTVPYNGLNYRELTPGTSLEYKHHLTRDIELDAVAGYTYGRAETRDMPSCISDWFGQCVRDRDPSTWVHQRFGDHTSFARANLSWQLHPQHTLRLALAPNYWTRSAKDLLYVGNGPDPVDVERRLWSLINGLEYQLDLWDGRIENIAFAKQYIQGQAGEELVIGNKIKEHKRDTLRFGVGDGLRVRVFDWLWLKASYEFATRLPSPDEVFGDNVVITSNLDLTPEISHNGNLGFAFDVRRTRAGDFRATFNAFLRDTDRLIMLLGSAKTESYQNVYSARSTGVESAIGWSSPREYLALDGGLTWQSFRNTSTSGTFVDYRGDRIPSVPYFMTNAAVRVQLPDVIVARDQFVVFWTLRYVHSFYRGWESLGDKDTKLVVPAQVVQSAGLGYVVRNQRSTLTLSMEVQNLTDERVYDYFGAQRPGRAIYAKTTATF